MTLRKGGVQTVYDLAEKHDSSLDLIEKNLGENDLVYELTEIDRRKRQFIRQDNAMLTEPIPTP